MQVVIYIKNISSRLKCQFRVNRAEQGFSEKVNLLRCRAAPQHAVTQGFVQLPFRVIVHVVKQRLASWCFVIWL